MPDYLSLRRYQHFRRYKSWRPGVTIRVETQNIAAAGVITDRGVDADTAGVWKSEMVAEIV